ncbi:hypothetical protein BD309DRAFT_751317 [Dichomitus squalens]|nr:hypothetical protein BD309DRAFT_751317 [Dichomitus squalens]
MATITLSLIGPAIAHQSMWVCIWLATSRQLPSVAHFPDGLLQELPHGPSCNRRCVFPTTHAERTFGCVFSPNINALQTPDVSMHICIMLRFSIDHEHLAFLSSPTS